MHFELLCYMLVSNLECNEQILVNINMNNEIIIRQEANIGVEVI